MKYSVGGHEHESNAEDYPYLSNVNHPIYLLPQNRDPAVLDVLGYDGPHLIENSDKFSHKRSPIKKNAADRADKAQAGSERMPKSKGVDVKMKKVVDRTKTEYVKLAAAPSTIANNNSTRPANVTQTTVVTMSSNSTTAKSTTRLTTAASTTTKSKT